MSNFIKEAMEDDILYHATFIAYIDSIRKEGLVPGKHKNWNDSLSDSIDLSDDIDVAASYCEVAEDVPDEVYDSGIAVIAIDSTRLDSNKLSVDENNRNGDTLQYKGIIPPSVFTEIMEYE